MQIMMWISVNSLFLKAKLYFSLFFCYCLSLFSPKNKQVFLNVGDYFAGYIRVGTVMTLHQQLAEEMYAICISNTHADTKPHKRGK